MKAELWVNSTMLSAASPYFKTLLETTGFSESLLRKRKRFKVSAAADLASGVAEPVRAVPAQGDDVQGVAPEPVDKSAYDSDEETDSMVKSTLALRVDEDDQYNDGDFTFREIIITSTCYTTYRAILLYIQSGFISFAPLSSYRAPIPAGNRPYQVQSNLQQTPPTIPTSPKSLYALAHLLEMPSLQSMALDEIRRNVALDNAATELFSETSALYDGVRDVLLDFVVRNWPQVKITPAFREVQRRVDVGELPHAGRIFNRLFERL